MRRGLPFLAGAIVGALVITLALSAGSLDRPAATFVPAPASAPATAPADERTTYVAADPLRHGTPAPDLLEAGGDDTASVGGVGNALPEDRGINFTIAGIVARAERDTDSALAAALALPSPEQRRLALLKLAPVLAAHDPGGALEHLDDIPERPLEAAFLAALLDAWAVRDAASVFEHLDALEKRRIPAAGLAFEALAEHDPERLLALAHELPATVAAAARLPAIAVLAARDFAAALKQIEAVSPGAQRSAIYQAAARAYGQDDPDAAWRWVQNADPSVRATSSVLKGIQEADPARALDLVLFGVMSDDTRLGTEMRQYVPTLLFAMAETGSSIEVLRALDQMASLNDASIDATLHRFVMSWSGRSPSEALEWTLRNFDRIEPGAFRNIGFALSRQNASLAKETLARLPDAARGPWITGASRGLAENSLEQGRAWAADLPRGPLRDTALAEYLSAAARGGAVDTQVFAEFSDAAARDTAASRVASGLACDGHVALGLEIARTYIADAKRRAAVERQIEGDVSRGGSIGGSFSNIVCEMSR